jgi:hypothetical protein
VKTIGSAVSYLNEPAVVIAHAGDRNLILFTGELVTKLGPGSWVTREVTDGELVDLPPLANLPVGTSVAPFGIRGEVVQVDGDGTHHVEITRDLASGMVVTNIHKMTRWRLEVQW